MAAFEKRGNRRRPAILLLLFSCAALSSADAAPAVRRAGHTASAENLSPVQKEWVRRAEDWLAAQPPQSGKFLQLNDGGEESRGRFYISRPGKLRFEYTSPVPLLLVSNDGKLVFQDKSIDQITSIPLSATPLEILLSDRPGLVNRVRVSQVADQGDSVTLTLQKKAHPEAGKIALVFSKKPFALKGWTVMDQQNRNTRVRLETLKADKKIRPEKFTLPKEE